MGVEQATKAKHISKDKMKIDNLFMIFLLYVLLV